MAAPALLVVGLGRMGTGIAEVAAVAGWSVRVADLDPDRPTMLIADLATRLGPDIAARVAAAEPVADAAGVDLVIEAVVEDLAVKRALLTELAAVAPARVLLATNTSSLSVAELAAGCTHPGRVLGLHFFNPATRMPLVEVVRTPRTTAGVIAQATDWMVALGKRPLVCQDAPGFIVNRACRPLYGEAQQLVAEGVAPAVVDALVRAALGHRLGPLETIDLVGLHTHLAAWEQTWREFHDVRYRPPPTLRRRVRAGDLGRATGRGYHDHTGDGPGAALAAVLRPPPPDDGGGIALVGGPAAGPGRVGPDPVQVVVTGGRATDADVAAVEAARAQGRAPVVVDSSDPRWLVDLPTGVGWVRRHGQGNQGVVEVVVDPVAGLPAQPQVERLLGRWGSPWVVVPAVPGLVVDRIDDAMANEAYLLAEEGVASLEDVDTAVRLGMRHPRGPHERAIARGLGRIVAGIDARRTATGDPRYQACGRLRRAAAGHGRNP